MMIDAQGIRWRQERHKLSLASGRNSYAEGCLQRSADGILDKIHPPCGVRPIGAHSLLTISIKRITGSSLNIKQKQSVGSRPALDINVTIGGKPISDMNGKVTISAAYELKPGEHASGIVVSYVDANGNRQLCETSYDPIRKQISWKIGSLSPSSVYMIEYDESRVHAYVTYTVQKGSTLSMIAKKHGCTVADIMAANSGLIKNPNRIFVGWQLKIPQD